MRGPLPAALALEVGGRSEISIHSARPADAGEIRRMAQLADRVVPAAPLLVAVSDGAIVAALSTSSGELLTDPFHATDDLVELLRLRAAQLHVIAA